MPARSCQNSEIMIECHLEVRKWKFRIKIASILLLCINIGVERADCSMSTRYSKINKMYSCKRSGNHPYCKLIVFVRIQKHQN